MGDAELLLRWVVGKFVLLVGWFLQKKEPPIGMTS